MNAFVRKECRLLLPLWGLAMALAVVAPWIVAGDHLHQLLDYVLMIYGFGVLLLGLAPFGQELAAGTFSNLLAQPFPRQRIWRTKVTLTTLAVATALIALLISCVLRLESTTDPFDRRETFGEAWRAGSLISLVALGGGFWTTLLFRQVGAAFWFTILVPGILLVLVSHFAQNLSPENQELTVFIVLAAYAVGGLLWSRRQFLKAQDTQWLGPTLALPGFTGRGAAEGTTSPALRPRKPFAALLGKELQSHQISLFIAFGLVVFHVSALIARKSGDFSLNSSLRFALESVPWLWMLLPWLIGSVAVAEERKLGTLESQLCLPTPARLQFAIKLIVALLLGVLLGGVMPWAIESIGVKFHVPSDFVVARTGSSITESQLFALILGLSATVVLLSFYASTFTRNTLQALGIAILVNAAFVALAVWSTGIGPDYRLFRPWQGRLVAFVGVPVLLIVGLALAWNNFRRVIVGRDLWFRNALTLALAILFSLAVTIALYQRVWELVIRVEPRHGPPVLHGSVRPVICLGTGSRVFALLPDGRLWAAGDHEWRTLDQYQDFDNSSGGKTREPVRVPVPINGSFLESSNWIALAGSQSLIAGLQKDGSLWEISGWFGPNHWRWTNLSDKLIPRQLGSDTDWQSISGSRGCIVALKRDGTLWGWGLNANQRLGPGPLLVTNQLERIGTESNWAKVFVSQDNVIGVQRDGSVWKWGEFNMEPRGPNGVVRRMVLEPSRSSLRGDDWVEVIEDGSYTVVLRRDGSLWGSGFPPFGSELVRLYRDSDWASFDGPWPVLVGLKKNGKVYENDVLHREFFGLGRRRPSRYSDWIAAGGRWEIVALAADGTLSCWIKTPSDQALLGPSHKPTWSLNILSDTAPP